MQVNLRTARWASAGIWSVGGGVGHHQAASGKAWHCVNFLSTFCQLSVRGVCVPVAPILITLWGIGTYDVEIGATLFQPRGAVRIVGNLEKMGIILYFPRALPT